MVDELDAAITKRIEDEVAESIKRFEWVNEACPYPFSTPEGRLFKALFNKAHDALMWRRATAPRV